MKSQFVSGSAAPARPLRHVGVPRPGTQPSAKNSTAESIAPLFPATPQVSYSDARSRLQNEPTDRNEMKMPKSQNCSWCGSPVSYGTQFRSAVVESRLESGETIAESEIDLLVGDELLPVCDRCEASARRNREQVEAERFAESERVQRNWETLRIILVWLFLIGTTFYFAMEFRRTKPGFSLWIIATCLVAMFALATRRKS